MPHPHDSSVFVCPTIGDRICRTCLSRFLLLAPDTESNLRVRSLHHGRIHFHPSHYTRAPLRDPTDTSPATIDIFPVIFSTLLPATMTPVKWTRCASASEGVSVTVNVVYLDVCGTGGPYRRRVESTSAMAVANASSCGVWRNRVGGKTFRERTRRLRVRAGPEGHEPREGSFAEDLFENLKDEVATSMSFMDPEQYVTRDPMTKREFRKSGQESRDQVRRAEKRILDFATSESFTKAGLFSVGTILFFYLAVVGAPPSDGKCTLPWC